MLRSFRIIVPIFFVVAGCQPGAPLDAPDAAPIDPLQQLEMDTGHTWTVRWHSDIHTPAFMEGQTAPLAATPTDAKRASRAFVMKYHSLFQLDGPDDEVTAIDAETDELGMTHARLQQKKGGVPIYGGDLVAHFASDGSLVRLNGRIHPVVGAATTAQLSSDQARVAAATDARALRPDADPDNVKTVSPELWLYPIAPDQVKLTWRVIVDVEDDNQPLQLECFVDASDGSIVHHGDLNESVDASGIGVFGDRKMLDVALRKNKYYLEDTARGNLKTYSAGYKSRLPGTEVRSSDPSSWDADVAGAGSAVDAHYYAGLAWDYYKNVHRRSGWDGKGSGAHVAVHFGSNYDNAYFDGKEIVLGDGDGKLMSPLAGALDVVAHEFTHGITAHTAKLIYQDESGALNEAISDIFGCLIAQANGGDHKWEMGAKIYHPKGRSTAIRNVAKPHSSGNPQTLDEYQQTQDDNGGVHLNSTIASHAAYLMAEGGEGVDALGADTVGKIWYRALAHYLHSKAGFADAADATLAAARDLGVGEDSVKAAWVAARVVSE